MVLIIVMHDMFVNCCIAMLYYDATGLDMVQEALCFPDIPLPRLDIKKTDDFK